MVYYSGKQELEVVEFEPGQLIRFRKLEQAGVTKEMLREFCDLVWDYVEDGAYFTVKSLRLSGFDCELFELGFSDWFYANLLAADARFSYTRAFSAIVLFKGRKSVSIGSFEESRIRAHGSIDVYDLLSELENVYGCKSVDRLDLVYKVGGTQVYYDKILERFYDSAETYYRELDEMEGI